MTSRHNAPKAVWWAGTLPITEACWLAGPKGPFAAECLGSIGCNNKGQVWIDEAARAWLSLLDHREDGACRWAADDVVEIQVGGQWYRLERDGTF